MSISYSQRYDDVCDECGAQRDFDVWLIVDRQERPDLWEYAREGTLHEAKCRKGHSIFLGVPLLLHDAVTQKALLVPFSERLMRHPTKDELQHVQGEIQRQVNGLIPMVSKALAPDAPRDYLRMVMIVAREDLARAMDEAFSAPADSSTDGLRQETAMLAEIDRPYGEAQMPARIELIESFLRAVDPKSNPSWWAMLQWRLGTSYGRSSVGDAAQNTEAAIAALTAAATVFNREQRPDTWASAQLNLSTMYLRRASFDSGTAAADDLRASIEAAEGALTWHTEERSPESSEIARKNLEEARRRLALEQEYPGLMAHVRQRYGQTAASGRERRSAFQEAPPTGRIKEVLAQLAALKGSNERDERIALLEEGLQLLDPETDAKHWAMLQLGLGNELVESGTPEEFDRGIEAFRRSRERLHPRRNSVEWQASFLNPAAGYFNRATGDRDENLQQAIRILTEGRDSFRAWQPPETSARLSYSLGMAYLERRGGDPGLNLEAGVAALREAQEAWPRETHPDQWADIQTQIGQGYVDGRTPDLAARTENAIEAFEAALRVYSREHRPEEWARVQRNLGRLYGHRLHVPNGEDTYERAIQALELARTVFTKARYPLQWADTTLELSWAYRYRVRGDLADNRERALEAVRDALAVYEQAGNPELRARAHQELGIDYVEREHGDAKENLRLARQAFLAAQQVRTHEAQPLAWATLEAEIGSAHLRAGETEQALARYQEAVDVYESLRERLDVDDRINLGSFYMILGQLYVARKLGDWQENWRRGLACLARAGELITRETYPGRWANLQALLMRAYRESPISDRSENLDRAITCGRAALEVQPPSSANRESSWLAFELAKAYAERGLWNEVYDLLREALDAADTLYTSGVTEATRGETIARNEDAYQLMIKACLRMNPPRLREAFLYAEAGRSRLLRDQLGSLSLPAPAGVPAAVLKTEAELLREIRLLDSSALRSPGMTLNRESLQRLRVARDKLDGLWEEMRRRHHADDYVGMRQGERVEWGSVTQWLAAQGPGVGVLEFYGLDQSFVAFVIRPGSDQPIVVELQASVAQQAKSFLDSLGRRRSERGSASGFGEGRQIGPRPCASPASMSGLLDPLATSILGPLMPHLTELDMLHVVPHGALHHVPIHALVWDGKPLIARVPLVYAPSVAVAMRMSTRSVESGPTPACTLVVGDPAGDLPFARAEAIEVAGLLEAQPLLGRDASKASVAAALGAATYAHFASHAHFDADDPFASGLQLADGVLSARELAGLATRTTLMVLSACETGVQRVQAGDELVGMARALSYSGVASLVLTLWRVDDEETKDLMLRFYRHLERTHVSGRSIAHALQAAVLETQLASPDPYLWAPFVAFGDCSSHPRRAQ